MKTKNKNSKLAKIVVLSCVFATPAITYGQSAPMEDAVPMICHHRVVSEAGVLTPIDTPCRPYSRNAVFNSSTRILGLRWAGLSEQKRQGWVNKRNSQSICMFQGGLWRQGTLQYTYSGGYSGRFDDTKGGVSFQSDYSCDVGVTIRTDDKDDRVGPSRGSKRVKVDFFVTNAGKKNKYWTALDYLNSAASTQPKLDTDNLAMNCRVLSGNSEAENYEICGRNPNSSTYCYAKFFAAPSKKFPYQGWWWVRGPSSDSTMSRKTEVCTGGITQQDAQEVADSSNKNQILRKTYRGPGNLASFVTIATALYDTKGDSIDNAAPADASAPGYRFSRVSKCLAYNPVATKMTWYTCTNKKSEQVLEELDFELITAGSPPVYDVVDSNEYQIADHEASTADCVIRPLAPASGSAILKIRNFLYTINGKRYNTEYQEAATQYKLTGFYKPSSTVLKDITPNVTYDATDAAGSSFVSYGPLRARGTNSDYRAAIVINVARKVGIPVLMRGCASVEYETIKVVQPAVGGT